jgi:hypothetical protein
MLVLELETEVEGWDVQVDVEGCEGVVPIFGEVLMR